MPKHFYCADCGRRGSKDEVIVSRHTGRSYCRDEKACARRVKRNERAKEKTS